MKDWFCANCQALTEIDCHGECIHCGSSQIDIAQRPPATAEGVASAYHIELDHYDLWIDTELLNGRN
jgi:hypothetical protein